MKSVRAVASAALLGWVVSAETANPLSKTIELMDGLAAKVTADGEKAAKAYNEYKEWCDDASKNAQFAIEDATKQKAKLEAQVEEFTSDIEVAESRIAKLGSAIASADSDLKNATTIRESEAKTFAASEAELMDTIDAVGRAIGILEKEMEKKPAALAQFSNANIDATVAALSTILDAASFPADDKDRLQALLQTTDEDGDEPPTGAPKAAAYESKSGGIVSQLEDLKEKAETQLSELRKAETKAKGEYKLLKASFERQVKEDKKGLVDEKSAKAEAEEGKATASGELETTVKTLKESKEELASTQAACLTTASDYEATLAAREEELKVLAEAKKVLVESTGGAEGKTYSFVQLSARAEATGSSDVVAFVKKLARKHHSSALAQLSSQIAAVAKYGGRGGADPFAKIKGLIKDMIAKLESEAEAEAEEKEYCDEQMSKTADKKGELEDDVAKMTAKIDSSVSKSASLKEEVKVLQQELAALSKEQAEMDKIRGETHADYVEAKKDLEAGLKGVRKALSVLRDFYGGGESDEASMLQQPAPPVKASKATGAGTSIIGLLEVVESDFAKNLAKVESEEADAASEYDKVTQENKLTQTTKQQDEKYKTQEAKSLDKGVADISADREKSSTELAAVDEYFAKIKERCVAKPETYEERAARRAAEIEGLKEAQRVLKDEVAFVQRHRRAAKHRRSTAFLAAH